jgi:hypothetical protein
MGKSWAPEVQVYGETKFIRNQTRYATEAEALAAVKNLHMRWTQVENYRVTEADEEPNCRWDATLGQVWLDEPADASGFPVPAGMRAAE